MKFATKEDLEAPIADVFDMLCDFEIFERAALRNGADVTRLGHDAEPGEGITWEVDTHLRGKRRRIKVVLSRFERPTLMGFDAASNAMKGTVNIELVALSRARTRMRVELDVRPLTLSARVLMQSAKLARNTLTRRYKTRVAQFAETLEERHKQALSQGRTQA